MANNKNKKGFKQTMKDAGTKVKNYSKSYFGDLRQSYDVVIQGDGMMLMIFPIDFALNLRQR